jgi:hypothetical protein
VKRKNKKYTCKGCGGTFIKGWSDEDAREEFFERHPGMPIDETTAMICDVCYKAIIKDIKENPWKYEGLDEC